MSTLHRPIIAVLGATGAQGGGLAQALLARGAAAPYSVRALTRNPDAPVAQELQAAGAELVRADLDDERSLRAAFDGVHGVFAVTDFYGHCSPERELTQARHIADAARDARVAHLVWSTLEDTRRWVPLDDDQMPTLMGRWKVPQFDAKGAANLLFRERGVPTTLLHTSVFWDRLVPCGLQRGSDGGLVFVLPMGERVMPGIAAEDVGACALAIFERGTWTVGRSVGIAGEHLSGAQMAASLTRVLGEAVQHRSPNATEYAARGCTGAADMANMFQFMHDFSDEFIARRPVADTRALHPGLLNFDGWLARHARRLAVPPPLALAGA